MANGIMSLFFGKKKSRRSSKKSVSGKTAKVSRKRIGYAIKGHRIVSVFKFKGLKGKRLANKHKLAKGKRVFKKKSSAKSSLKKKLGKTSKKMHRRRRSRKSAFGTGGSYMPLESFMAPYPYSVDSSPPWI